jgi:hypothetical protein
MEPQDAEADDSWFEPPERGETREELSISLSAPAAIVNLWRRWKRKRHPVRGPSRPSPSVCRDARRPAACLQGLVIVTCARSIH